MTELAELNVVYDHTDDGELMQLLFGLGGACVMCFSIERVALCCFIHEGPM